MAEANQATGEADQMGFQTIPNISIKKTLLKLRSIGISNQKVFQDIGISAKSSHYTSAYGCEPSFSKGVRMWNYAVKRLTIDELKDCLEDE